MSVYLTKPRRRLQPWVIRLPGLWRPGIRVLLAVLIGVCLVPRTAFADPETPEDALSPAEVFAGPAAGGGRRVLLPTIQTGTPGGATGASYDTIPVLPPVTDRPAAVHADLNLAVRSYVQTPAPLSLVDYGGDTDLDAPQMPDLFSDGRTPKFTSAYRVYDWDWGCSMDGCRGAPLTTYPVTLLGLETRPGDLLAAPKRLAEIYRGGYTALVLYAEPTRITLKYTREDNVVRGYTVHIEKLLVDADLLDRYTQANLAGRFQLPALKNGQLLGKAPGSEILVAIRDTGAFMDPRSRKDWWSATP